MNRMTMDRRGFLDRLARGGLLGLLLFLAGFLVTRRKVTLGGSACSGNYRCGSCNEFGICELPEAKEAKKARADSKEGKSV